LLPPLPNLPAHQVLVGMDSNLHHPLWNPPGYLHVHQEAKDLLRMMAAEGLDLHSEPDVPTFYPSNPVHSNTTVDLMWMSNRCLNWTHKCCTDVDHTHSHLSNHAAILTKLRIPA
ncbi:hypothetical protein CROQUDRAFT_29300, partial [Cronartium quercuum f. sp. fusiforme G11]